MAIAAGVEHAGGDAPAVIAADLQDPPECFLDMPERDRFMRGMAAWIGFRQEPPPRPKPAARPGAGSPLRPTGSPPSCAANGPSSLRRIGPVITDDYELGLA